jgi:selenocysteine lyase/cysteine desulfurase
MIDPYDEQAWRRLRNAYLPKIRYIDFRAAEIGQPLHSGKEVHDFSNLSLHYIKERMPQVRAVLANLLNCDANRVLLTHNTTRALDLAIRIAARSNKEIITSDEEYGSNYTVLEQYMNLGVPVRVVPAENIMDELRRAVSPQTGIIATPHISHLAREFPVQAIGQLAREHKITYVLDAAQSIGHIPVNAQELGADIIIGCGHKWLRGKTVSGFAYVRPEIQLSEQLPASAPYAFAHMTDSTAEAFYEYDAYGNAPALVHLHDNLRLYEGIGWDALHARMHHLGNYAHDVLADNPNVSIFSRAHAMLMFRVRGEESENVWRKLAARNIAVTYKQDNDALRIAACAFNTKDQIDVLNRALGGRDERPWWKRIGRR